MSFSFSTFLMWRFYHRDGRIACRLRLDLQRSQISGCKFAFTDKNFPKFQETGPRSEGDRQGCLHGSPPVPKGGGSKNILICTDDSTRQKHSRNSPLCSVHKASHKTTFSNNQCSFRAETSRGQKVTLLGVNVRTISTCCAWHGMLGF